MIKTRKVCIVTGARSEFGLLKNLAKRLKLSKSFELQIIASAMHFDPHQGSTFNEILDNGFTIDKKIEMLISDDSSSSKVKSMGVGLISFADALRDLNPDILIVLGDRFEALVASQAALMMKIPLAHIHGGELTFGAIDNEIRHAITKMSNIHFVAHPEYQKRVIQMGEDPKSVFLVGPLGLENLRKVKPIAKKNLEQLLGLKFSHKNALLTFHPETKLSDVKNLKTINNILSELIEIDNLFIIATNPNSDSCGKIIESELTKYSHKFPNKIRLFKNLGFEKYVQTLHHIDFLIGNSSSAIHEAPFLGLKAINVGDRQKGRVQKNNIINSLPSRRAIKDSIASVINEIDLNKKYGIHFEDFEDGYASKHILKELEKMNFRNLTKKNFFNLT